MARSVISQVSARQQGKINPDVSYRLHHCPARPGDADNHICGRGGDTNRAQSYPVDSTVVSDPD